MNMLAEIAANVCGALKPLRPSAFYRRELEFAVSLGLRVTCHMATTWPAVDVSSVHESCVLHAHY